MSDRPVRDYTDLLEAARQVTANAYAPFSHYAVGCALRCSDGTVFVGCNVENSSYGLTICAERSAVACAVSAGHRDFQAVAIYASGADLPMPCGACRQVLAEFGPHMAVIVSNGRESRTFSLDELLPYAFAYRSAPSAQAPRSPRGGGR